MTLFLPLNDDGSPLAGGRVTVQRRWDDWIAFATNSSRRWECAPTADAAIRRLRVSCPDLFEDGS